MTHTKRSLVCLLLSAASSFAVAESRSQLNFNYYSSTEEVGFSIASDVSGTATPNILSELSWDDVEVHKLNVRYSYRFYKGLAGFVEGAFGMLEDGDVTDSDFLGDNRTQEFSRSVATVDGKHQHSVSAGLIWRFIGSFEQRLWKLKREGRYMALASEYTISPYIGYWENKQSIRFVDGIQVIPPDGPFPGLRSKYKPEWRGMFVGISADARLVGRVYLELDARYFPDVNFTGLGQWNLRQDLLLDSFEDSADADGYQGDIALAWHLSDNMNLKLGYRFSEFETEPGDATVNTVFGISLRTRLNEARWRTSGWRLGYQWKF